MPTLKRPAPIYRRSRIERPLWPFEINRRSSQAEGLVAWYPLWPHWGENYAREMVNGLNATAGGSPGWNYYTQHGLRGAYDFDGVGDYFTVVHDTRLDITGDITLWAWIRRDTNADYGGIIAKTDASNWDYDLLIDGSNNIDFFSDSTGTIRASSTYTNTTDFRLLCFRRVGSACEFFLDGASIGTATNATSLNANTFPVEIGRDGNWSAVAEFNGQIAEARIYNRGLSDLEMAAGFNPSTRWELYQPINPILAADAESVAGGTPMHYYRRWRSGR